MPRYIISYDIANDTRRRRVADCLDSYGDRVLESVFELKVSQALLGRCMRQVKAQLNLAEDEVAVYRLCATCEAARSYLGANQSKREIGDEQVFIA